MTGDFGSRTRKWRNDQQGEKAGQVRVRGRQRQRGDRETSGSKDHHNRRSDGEKKEKQRSFRRRRNNNENYYLTKTPPFWPFHFSISAKLNDKAAMELKGVKEEVVLRLCSGLNTPSPLPESLTMLIETNARLFELYGDSHPWRYKHTLSAPPLCVSSPCYANTQIDVVGVSVVEWVPIPLRPSTEELEGIIESAFFSPESISVAFVNVGEYSTPDQRRLSACCMVKWEKDGFLIELQVCCQTYFSVVEVTGDDGEKRIELSQSRKGQAYISGYRGFSIEVPDKPYHQIWEALLPFLKERSEQMLKLRKKVGVHILGDFDAFEMRKVFLLFLLFLFLFFFFFFFFLSFFLLLLSFYFILFSSIFFPSFSPPPPFYIETNRFAPMDPYPRKRKGFLQRRIPRDVGGALFVWFFRRFP